MYCRKCGAECKDSAKFCSKCGAPLQTDASKNDEALSTPESTDDAAAGMGSWFQRNKKIAWTILIVIIAIVVAIIAVSVARHSSKNAVMSADEHLKLGARYLEDGEYAEAVDELKVVLDVEQNMQAYTYLAEAYLDLSDTEDIGEVQVEFNDKVYEGAAKEVYVDVAGEVYEEAVAYALDTYGQKGELPEGTDIFYGDAKAYEDQYDRDVPGLPDLSTYIHNDESDENKDIAENTQEENPPSEEEVEGLLDLFAYMANDMLYEYYDLQDCDVLENGITSAQQVYYLAAQATCESGDGFKDYNPELKIIDGHTYEVLPTERYENYLRNMFGSQYSISNFVETKNFIIKDSDGTLYITVGDYGDVGDIEITIENISATSNEEDVYDVLAKYTVCAPDETSYTRYMLYRLQPDDSSDYGWIIADMIPAGDGELDEEYRSLVEEDESNEESYMEWQQLYADYIEQVYLEEDTEAERAYAEDLGEWLEDYYYYLIYLNDDDVPELLRCSPDDPYRGNNTDDIVYIQDSQVKAQEIWNVKFAERGGYISGGYGTGAYMEYSVWRLNEQNELVTELEEYEDFSEILINGQDVSQEEFDRADQEGTAWMTSGEYTVLFVGNGTLDLSGSLEEYASPFATGASEAIEALRSGYVEPV